MAKHKRVSRPAGRPPEGIEDRPLPDSILDAMVPARDVLSDILAGKRPLGRPPKADKKKLVSLRLDADVLEAFRALGEGWQTKINETLRSNAPKRPRTMRLTRSGRMVSIRGTGREGQTRKPAAQGKR